MIPFVFKVIAFRTSPNFGFEVPSREPLLWPVTLRAKLTNTIIIYMY